MDNAGWFTAAQYYTEWMVTANLNVQYLEAASGVSLFATGKLLKKGKSIAFCDMDVFDDRETRVACGTGTFVVTNKRVP